ncbi:TPA: hypothetical protein NV714_002316 [Escherichia coli]|nr:hypothetical protein [Escherichia coli]
MFIFTKKTINYNYEYNLSMLYNSFSADKTIISLTFKDIEKDLKKNLYNLLQQQIEVKQSKGKLVNVPVILALYKTSQNNVKELILETLINHFRIHYLKLTNEQQNILDKGSRKTDLLGYLHDNNIGYDKRTSHLFSILYLFSDCKTIRADVKSFISKQIKDNKNLNSNVTMSQFLSLKNLYSDFFDTFPEGLEPDIYKRINIFHHYSNISTQKLDFFFNHNLDLNELRHFMIRNNNKLLIKKTKATENCLLSLCDLAIIQNNTNAIQWFIEKKLYSSERLNTTFREYCINNNKEEYLIKIERNILNDIIKKPANNYKIEKKRL